MTAQPRTIVVGVDGSPASRTALQWALNLAATQDFHVTAVAVQRRSPAFVPATSMALLPHGTFPEPSMETRAERLHSVVEAAGDHHATVTELLLTGEPARELTQLAGLDDLLVVGSHGAITTATALLGSITMGCLRHARCPVVIVPADRGKESHG
ncbi:universal stress protein [Kibdelosporangium philippinense]|uniref:Universal stress protein n=1 Tax=Kibdelosporangium philippinense TaxID=211113 RepID=A0ABS8Z9S0_9PSEU|nr:universal stress protein [Kibdelosporangium philippinense]MCE7004620.1 universal stress protein [Kibdelosporangium philippinense]